MIKLSFFASTRRLLVICCVILLYTFSRFNSTNAFFVDFESIPASTSTGCWVAPSEPKLLYPENDSKLGADSDWSDNPYLDWEDSGIGCPLAPNITYDLQVYTDENLTNKLVDETTTNTEFDASSFNNGHYWWRVRACDDALNCSDWSQVFNFEFDDVAPTVAIDNPEKFKESSDELSGEVNIKISIEDENDFDFTLLIEDKDGNDIKRLEKDDQKHDLNDETIMRWDTKDVENGEYVIKLSAEDEFGNYKGSDDKDEGILGDSVHWIRVKVLNEHEDDKVVEADAAYSEDKSITNETDIADLIILLPEPAANSDAESDESQNDEESIEIIP